MIGPLVDAPTSSALGHAGRRSRPLRLVILTQYYPPEMGAPQGRLSDLARRFIARGHEVHVLTAMPSYPVGRVAPGYGGFYRREVMDGATVRRAAIFPSQSPRLVPRLASYFSFVGSSALVGAATLPRADYLLTESPPLFLGLSGYFLSRWTRARWIFNVSDLWPESAVRLGVVREGRVLRAARALEAFCYRKAWLITGQSRGILNDIGIRFPEVPTYHLTNGVDTEFFHPGRRTASARARLLGKSGAAGCVAIYAGLHGLAQGLDHVIDAAHRLGPDSGLTFVLVGDGPEKARLVARARDLGLSHVRFLDPQPRAEMAALVASADIALVTLGTTIPGAVPSKLYEAMGCGLPVALMADGEAAAILGAADGGISVAPGDTEGLASALRALADDPTRRATLGARGRHAAVSRFDRGRIAHAFIDHLEAGLAMGPAMSSMTAGAVCS